MTSTRASRIQGGAGQLLQLRIPSPTKLDRRQTPASARRCPGTTYTAAALLTQPHPHISCRVPDTVKSSQVMHILGSTATPAIDGAGGCVGRKRVVLTNWFLGGLVGRAWRPLYSSGWFLARRGGNPRYPQGIRWWALSMVERHATRPEALLSSEGCGKRGRVYISASSPGGYCFAIYISFPAASVVLTLDLEPPSNQPRNSVLRDQTRHPVAYRAAHPSIPLVRPVCHPPEFPGPEFRIGVRLARGVTRRDN